MKKLALMPAGAAAPREVPTDDGGVLGNVPLAAVAGAVGRGADVGGRRGRGVPKLQKVIVCLTAGCADKEGGGERGRGGGEGEVKFRFL